MTVEKEFWNKRYAEGGISGRGSIGKYRNWKWGKIKEMIPDLRDVLDVGCGDLKFWKHPIAREFVKRKGFTYLGIDSSDFIIDKNKVFAPKFDFVCAPSHLDLGEKAQVVFALDLLFHIMDDGNFEETLEQLCKASNQWIVIYSWQKNPFPDSVTDGVSQYFRKLSDYCQIFESNDFRLKEFFQVPFDPYGVLYFMKRVLY